MRYGSHTGQKMAKKSVPGVVEAKPEVEIWRKPVFPTQRPRLPIRLRILYRVYLAPLRIHRERILTLAHCNGRGTLNIIASGTQKCNLSRFFQLWAKFIWVTRVRFFLNLRIDSRLQVLAIDLKFQKFASQFSRKSGPKCKPAKIHISPKWGAIAPEQKVFLSGSLRPKSPRVTWGKGAPKGANSKKCHAPKIFKPHFLENVQSDFF